MRIEGRMVATQSQHTERIEIRNPDCKSNSADGLCDVCRRLVWLPAACMREYIYGMSCSSVAERSHLNDSSFILT